MSKRTRNEFLIKKKNPTQFLNQIKYLRQLSDFMYRSVFFFFILECIETIISGVFCKPWSFESKENDV